MAQKKIIFSPEAQNAWKDIVDFYAERNGNSSYSKKITSELKKNIQLIKRNNHIGKPAIGRENTRVLIFKVFMIYYQVFSNHLEVLIIWDGRRNPNDMLKFLEN